MTDVSVTAPDGTAASTFQGVLPQQRCPLTSSQLVSPPRLWILFDHVSP